MAEIEEYRSFYARYVVAVAGSSDASLVRAFAAVPRERFVSRGPWDVFTPGGYVPTGTDDPRILYQDILIALAGDRFINNGQPSLHARSLAALRLVAGEIVVHVGAGTGYYSAVLSELVGTAGSVHAYEIEPDLASLASENLKPYPNVRVQHASASALELPKADVVYVNAGATHPLESWLDALSLGGRLLFPLTADNGGGGMLLITHVAVGKYSAKFISPARFIPCAGARDEAGARALAVAFARGKVDEVQSLWRNASPDQTVWCSGASWWLSTAPL